MQYLAMVLLYRDGELLRQDWDLTMGQGFDTSTHMQPTSHTVGTLPPTNHWGGGALYSRTVWLYPRFRVGVTGVWEGGVMVQGTESELEKVRCREGVMQVITRNTGSVAQRFEPPSMEQICSDPHQVVMMDKDIC